jgi:predicted dehydrogenase
MASAAGAVFTIIPRHVLGGAGYTAPSDKLNIAAIGIGGQGSGDLGLLTSENIVALCDVDDNHAGKTFDLYPNAKKYRDYRVMLEKQKDIDAVLIATPDHSHAMITMAAIKAGKHVYCEKPLTHTIYEAREITKAAREHKVVSQMGIQLHALECIKLVVEMIQSGTIGTVRQVHLWSGKCSGNVKRPTEKMPVPATLDWDLWLGPAPYRDYHSDYVPYKWRNWLDFGTGTMGDMGCHIFDPAVWALDLKAPVSVETHCSESNQDSYPISRMVHYEFAARGKLPEVSLTWYDGEYKPFLPKELELGRKLPEQGGIYVGDKGTILATHMAGARLIPESKMKDFQKPEPLLPRGLDHYQDWIQGCKGGSRPLADFSYSGPLTEMVLLGNVAMRAGQRIYWDSDNLKVTNMPEANEYLHHAYRSGWSL